MSFIELASALVFSFTTAAVLFCFACWFLFGLGEFWLFDVEATDEAVDGGRLGIEDIVVVVIGFSVDIFDSGKVWNNINYIK